MRSITRRTFLRGSAAGAAAIAAPAALPAALAAAQALPPYVGAGSTAAVRPFPLTAVRVGAGLFKEKQDRMLNFARQYDERRFLVLFNDNAGRPSPPGVSPPGGWEDGGLLSGHWAGHFLTLLAQSYTATGEAIFKSKLDWMVAELAACQQAITDRIGGGGGGGGGGAPIGRVPGRFGSAVRLGGPSNAAHMTLPQEVGGQLADFTIAAWVNPAATTQWARIFDFGTGTGAYMFLTVNAGSGPRFAITTGGWQNEHRVSSSGQLPVNAWTHLAVTLTGTVATVYRNGQAAGVNSSVTVNPSQIGPGNNWIGRSQFGNDPPLNATVDEVHVFSRALTAGEVQSLTTSPAGSTGGGNIAWYRLDETGGATADDSSGSGRDAGIVAVPAGGDTWVPTHPGYLGAVPEDAVLRLGPPRFAVYGGNPDTNTWAPWYTQHKIMRGLLDAYYLTGNQQAFDVVAAMADWAHLALTVGDLHHPDYPGPITRDDLNFMWDTYIAGEFGGANEVFPEIYALTGDQKHLQTAKLFDNRESLFDACVDDLDILVTNSQTRPGRRRPNVLHANTHVPQFTGYLRIFERTGEPDYRLAAENFFGMVVPHRMFSHGGTSSQFLPLPGVAAGNSNAELFQPRGDVSRNLVGGQYSSGGQTVTITGTGAETCTTYNLIKLARNLFFHDPDPAYMDYVERGLVNHILGSRQDTTSTGSPMVTYFLPPFSGASRGFGNTGTCCGGTGMENHTKYPESVYFHSADGSALWVNLYLASTLTWSERGFTIVQETDYPRAQASRLTIQGSGPLALRLRVPGWAERGFAVAINGVDQGVDPIPGSYLTLNRTWSAGDTVEIAVPFSLRVERASDDPAVQSLFYGPVLLTVLGGPLGNPPNRQFIEFTWYGRLKRDGDLARAAVTPAGSVNHFTSQGRTLRPLYVADTQSQHLYFRRSEPEVVFGSIGTGVPNDGIPDQDGLTFLDRVWEAAPFTTHDQFVQRVDQVSNQWRQAGRHSAGQRQAILTAAASAEEELRP